MGALVAITLGIERPQRLSGLVLVAPFLHSCDPLAPFAGLLAPIIRDFPAPKPPQDEGYVCTNYTWFPTASFVEAYKFQRDVERRLSQLALPLLILGSEKDKLAHPRGLRQIYATAPSTDAPSGRASRA
jgi:alpha-beta hydrolase superfamily lysophospholipase